MATNYQTKLIKKYKSEGWIVINTIKLSEAGFPDLFLFRNGVAMFIEVKQRNDTLKPLQRYRLDELAKQGFKAVCLHETKGVIYEPDR